MNSVVHFEIAADEPQRAKKFYSLFGWDFVETSLEMGNYILCHTTKTDKEGMPQRKGAINGGIMTKDKITRQTILTIGVTDLKNTLKKVKKSGGKVISETVTIPGVGDYCRIEDTEGNVVSLMEPTMEYKEKAKKLK